MDLGADLSWFGMSLKIFFIDILLSGDNALLIALACRSLPAGQVRKAILLGAAGAIFFRLIVAALAGTLMTVPLLKIGGGLLLATISINLLAGEYRRQREGDRPIALDPSIGQGSGLLGAALVILIADAIVSLDNVVALAAVSEGHLTYLVGGVQFSAPLIFFGSFVMTEAMTHVPGLILVGTAFLGWIAGSLVVSAPLWSGWIAANAEALFVLVPPAAAIFVVAEARFTADARAAGERSAHPNPTQQLQMPPLRQTPVPTPVRPPRQAVARAELPAAAPPARPAVATVAAARLAATSPGADAADADRVVIFGLIGLFVFVAVVMASVLIMAHGVG